MALDKRIKSKGGIEDWLTSMGIHNMYRDEYNQLAFDDQKALQDLLDQYANDPTSLEKELSSRGMLKADGTPDVKKMIDTGFLQNIKDQAQESSNLNAQTALRNARMTAMSKGTPGASTAYTGGLAKTLSDMNRRNQQDYANAYKGESENAYNKTLGWGQQALADTRYGRGEAIRARKNQADVSAGNAGAQTGGLLSFNLVNDLIGGLSGKSGASSSSTGGGQTDTSGAGNLVGGIGNMIGGWGGALMGLLGNKRKPTKGQYVEGQNTANAYDKGNGEWGV